MAIRVLIGAAFGEASPVVVHSPTLYLDLSLHSGASVALPLASERALRSVDAPFTLDGETLPAQCMVVLGAGESPRLAAAAPARVVLIGGEPLGYRHMTWTFVSSRKARIEQAIDDWRAQRFDSVPGETDFIAYP